MLTMEIINSAIALFLIYNVLGQLPMFIAILAPFSHKRQKYILFREMIIGLFILFLFGFFGKNILYVLGINQSVIGISGGILLFILSITMIFPKAQTENNNTYVHEPLIVPIAIPALAGPGSIATVMLYSDQFSSHLIVTLIIFLAWLPSLALIMSASYVRCVLGEKGLMAFERLGGLLICLIAVQMFTSGVVKLTQDSFNVSNIKTTLIK